MRGPEALKCRAAIGKTPLLAGMHKQCRYRENDVQISSRRNRRREKSESTLPGGGGVTGETSGGGWARLEDTRQPQLLNTGRRQ